MIHTEVAGDAAQIHPIHIHSDGLLAEVIGIALLFGVWCVATLAIFAAVALASRLCRSNFDLVLCIVEVRTSYHTVILTHTLTFPHSLA